MPENTHFAGDCSSDGPLLDIKNFKNKGGAAVNITTEFL